MGPALEELARRVEHSGAGKKRRNHLRTLEPTDELGRDQKVIVIERGSALS